MFKSIYHFFHRHYHTRYHGIYRHAKKLFVFDMALMASAIVMLGTSLFFFFWKPSLANLIDLNISFGNERILSGEQVHLTIDYANRTEFKLSPATLSIHLPAGFVIDRNQTPSSYFSDQSTIDLGTLLPGAKGRAEIYGTIWTAPNTEERITAYLSYQPIAKSHSAEQKIAAAIIKLPGTVLQTKLISVTTSLPNQIVPFSYSITNTGKNKVEHIKIFTTDPNTVFDNNLTELTLAPNETQTLNGKINMGEKTNHDRTVQFFSNIIVAGKIIAQNSDNIKIQTISASAQSAVTITNNTKHVEPKQALPISVSWKNNSASEIKNALIKIKFAPTGVVDLKATALANNLSVKDGMLIVDKTKRTLLANLKPNTEDNLNLDIKMLSGFKLGQVENTNLEITPVFSGEVTELTGQTLEQTGQAAKLPITTELKFTAEPRYFTPEGDQVGRGLLPPRVGETTKYWIFAQILNTSNEVKNAHLAATLPPGVEFTGKQSVSLGPKIQLDEIAHTAVWSYTSLPANSITGLYFEVAITPTGDQVGQAISLIKNISFTATDKITGKNFSLTAPDLNNKLPADDMGYEAGYLVTE